MTESIEDLRFQLRIATAAIDDLTTQNRLSTALLAGSLVFDMVAGALWIISDQSVTGRVAQLSSYPKAMAAAWLLLAVLTVPYMVMQTCAVWAGHKIKFIELACFATFFSGAFWVFLGYLSKNLDYQYVTTIFVINGLINVATSTILAYGLNAAQKHKLLIGRLKKDYQAGELAA